MPARSNVTQDRLWVFTLLPVLLLGLGGMVPYAAYYALQATRPELVAGVPLGRIELWLALYLAAVRWILLIALVGTLHRMGNSLRVLIAPGGSLWRFRLGPAVLLFLAFNALTAVFLLGLARLGYTALFSGLPRWQSLALVAVTAITAGFTEEVIWRGYDIGRLEARRRSRAAAIVLAAVAFTFIHSSPLHWPYAFAIGLVAGAYYTRERALAPLICSHLVIDLWGFGLFA